MGIDRASEGMEAVWESFREDLDAAADFAKELGARTPLQDLSTFDEVAGYESEMIQVAADHFGVNLTAPQVVKAYEMDGTPGSPGEGKIKVSVIKTNEPEVFLGKYEYADGSVVWAVRLLECEE